MKKLFKLMFSVAIVVTLFTATAFAASSTLVVSPSNNQGWQLNPDPSNTTPYNFTNDESSIGAGSLYVQPIGATPAHKFIALKPLNKLVGDINSISYDFLIAGDGTVTDSNQFYLNVYANLPGSTTFYDCRFDYVPAIGSTSSFTTVSFNSGDAATNVDDRFDGTPRPDDGYNCPATLAQMAIDQPGATVSGFTLNVGDTSANDTGLAGYFDNAVVNLDSGVTTYDFELYNVPTSKEQCKKDGYKTLQDSSGNPFKNQGQCVSYFNHQ